MSDDDRDLSPAQLGVRRVDEEFAAERGSTVSGKALDDEHHGEVNRQGPGELGHKIRAEAGEGEGPVGKVKRALEEVDRDVSGEYEARQEGR